MYMQNYSYGDANPEIMRFCFTESIARNMNIRWPNRLQIKLCKMAPYILFVSGTGLFHYESKRKHQVAPNDTNVILTLPSDLDTSQESKRSSIVVPHSPIISIDVSSNQITSLDHLVSGGQDFASRLSTLKKLDLSNNTLDSLPNQLFQVHGQWAWVKRSTVKPLLKRHLSETERPMLFRVLAILMLWCSQTVKILGSERLWVWIL